MKVFTISFALIAAALVTGCSGQSTASTTSESQQPQIVYKGDSPEAARYKAHAECLKSAWENERTMGKLQCDERFGSESYSW